MNRQVCALVAITFVAAQRRPQPRPPGRRRGPLLRDVAQEAKTRLPHNAVSMTALVRAGIVKCGQPPNVRNCSSDEPAVRLTRVDCPSRPRPGSTPEYLYFTPVAANRFSDVHRERLLGRTGGVHLCKAGDPQVVDPARSIGDYRLKGELPTGAIG